MAAIKSQPSIPHEVKRAKPRVDLVRRSDARSHEVEYLRSDEAGSPVTN